MTIFVAGALLGLLIAGAAGAQQSIDSAGWEASGVYAAGAESEGLAEDLDFEPVSLHDRIGLQGASHTYSGDWRDETPPIGEAGKVRMWLPIRRPEEGFFGYLGLREEAGLHPLVSYMRRHAGFGYSDWMLNENIPESVVGHSQVFSVGYGWRAIQLEGSSVLGSARLQSKPLNNEPVRFKSRSTRLSFSPAPNWTLRLSRGAISGLDQLVSNGDVRRSAISATYIQPFKESTWETTLAWGRSARKFRESTTGYLIESTVRFSGAHAIFGRLEQVGSDELLRQDESLERRLDRLRKLTFGYSHHVSDKGPIKFDIGVMASRYFVPAEMAASYGDNPTFYMMFVRVNLR